MSGTALNHPLVRNYLCELDLALAALPAEQASELTEQITADPAASDPGPARYVDLHHVPDEKGAARGSTG